MNSSAPPDATPTTDPTRARGLSRRAVIIGGSLIGVGLIAAGAAGESLVNTLTTKKPVQAKPAAVSYVSTELTHPGYSAWKTGETAEGLIFVEPHSAAGSFSGLITDEMGEAVWIEPTRANLTDLRVSTYQGRPVITYWSGKSIGGHGQGSGTILDTHYQKVTEVKAGNGLLADLHEFNLTDRGTALITAYSTVRHDLRPLGGIANGYMYDCHVQEIDIATGKVLLDWSTLDHVDITETYLGLHSGNGGNAGADGTTAPNAFDPFHINSIDADGDTLLVSLRHTHTIYRIDRKTGKVIWKLGGKHSDWKIAPEAVFAWQHDVRKQPGGFSIFDNHYYSGTAGQSRGMFFELHESTMTAVNTRTYTYESHLGTATGSVQQLPNGNVLVGWGTDPYNTEFTHDGTAIYQGTMGGSTYRAYRSPWTAQPATKPDIALVPLASGKVRVYASWNGATEVASWRVMSGVSASALDAATTVARSGFETAATIPHASSVAVQALDRSGGLLATSAVITT